MPGVPSSRGCEACRKQKKKCDQIKPLCSRCTRLRIACVGSGERRFKFMFVGNQPSVSQSTSVVQRTRRNPQMTNQEVIRAPSSPWTMMAGAFCNALEVSDVRYDLSVYGLFLKDIPRRLGSSKALDTSVNAFTTIFSSLYSSRRSPEVYRSYMEALKALRVSLNNLKEVRSTHTMCAIYLVLVCQGWIGQSHDNYGHGEAISHLLNSVSTQPRPGTFESDLMTTLTTVVIVESLYNPRIPLGPWLGKFIKEHDKKITIPSLKLATLSSILGLIHNPAAYQFKILSIYQQFTIDIAKTRKDMAIIAQQVQNLGYKKNHAHCQGTYGIMLTLALMLNTILRSFDLFDSHLLSKSISLVDEILSLAENAAQYRPLGSTSMPLGLASAWAATNDSAKRLEIEKILAEYQSDFSIVKWRDLAAWLETYLSKDHVPLSKPLFGGPFP